MAIQHGPQNYPGKEEVTVITDINGDTVVEIGSDECVVLNSKRRRIFRKSVKSILTVDGMQWNPGMQNARPPIYIGICQQCRDRTSTLSRSKSHGIVTLPRAKLCVRCGTLSCPSHRKLGRDQRWRCLKHHRQHLLSRLVRPLFFKRKD
jgi:hypothetical protein